MEDEIVQPNNGVEVVTPTEPPPPSWFIEEGVPGIGERPSWLNEKYKTVADLAKSNSELEKRLGQVPDKYDLSKSKFIDADYAPFQDFMDLAKEKRVPQEVMDKMVESFDKYMDEFSTDYNEETLKLGDNAKERLTVLDNWAKANLSENSYLALTSNLKNADSIKALEELRGKMMSGTTVIPSGNDDSSSNISTLDDVRAELSNNLEKYKVDPAYRKDLQYRLELASKSSGYIDKIGS